MMRPTTKPKPTASDAEHPYGLAIKRELEDYYTTPITHGHLYPTLNTLVAKGLIEKGTIDNRTNSYKLTERGREALHARQDWETQYLSPSP